MRPFVRLTLALLLSALLAGCGSALAEQPPVPTATPEPSPTAIWASTPTPEPASLPDGAQLLAADTAATWDPAGSGPPELVLSAGTAYTYAGEQARGWCRLVLIDGAQPWVPCAVIGVEAAAAPAPTAAAAVAPIWPAWAAPLFDRQPAPAAAPVEPTLPPAPIEPPPLTATPAPSVACASFVFPNSDGNYYTGCGASYEAQRADAAIKATAAAGGAQ